MKIRLSPDELEHITHTAELLNISRSEYLRRQALTGTVGNPVIKLSYDSDTLNRTNVELNKIGSNLNQIAHHLNAKNPAQTEILNRIEKMIDILMEETEQIRALLA
ncbi:MAG: MobC family plasmid mobilization relaxosome protein [Lachnospiraceae bacterium]|nr:MobC family plasmid mobilization relaxosome protein [Lachnospiraceae bacterium]